MSAPFATAETGIAAPRPVLTGAWRALWRNEPVEALFLAGLLLGLAWAPFWLGGDRWLAWGVNGILFPSLVLGYELSILLRGKRRPVALKNLRAPVILFCAVVAWIGVQVTPYAPQAFAHPIWGMASDVLGKHLNGVISVNPQASLLALMRLLTDASVLWLSIQLCRDPARASLLIEGVVAIVFAFSLYGLVLFAFARSAIPFFDAPDLGRFVRSTFVNRNNFATYAGLGLIGAVALILRLLRHEVPNVAGVRFYRLSRLIEATGARGWRLIGAALVIMVALLGTVSRGGIFSTGLGLFALFMLSLARRERRGGQGIETILFVAVALVAAFVFFGDQIVGRISESGVFDAGRSAVYQIVLRSILDSPWLGFGYGAFTDIFPMYRDHSISANGVWDMAHNSYLEVLQGLGVIFGGALIAAIALLAWKCLRGAVARRRSVTAPIVASCAALLVGAHAMVDFSVQIEAVAVTFMALLGAGVAQSESSRHVLSN